MNALKEVRPELRLSRRENFYRCPALVILIFGYFLASIGNLFFFGLRHESPFGLSIHAWVYSPCAYLCLMMICAAMTGADHRRIFSAQMYMVAEILWLGIKSVYVTIAYPYSFVLDQPRMFFSSYAAKLVAGTGHALLIGFFLAMLFLPHIRRWAKSGVRSEEEAILVAADRLKKQLLPSKDGSESSTLANIASPTVDEHNSSSRWLRPYPYLIAGIALFLSVSYFAALVGRPVPKADEMSYEALIQQLDTKDHWQLRVRDAVSQFVGRHVLKYSTLSWSKMPPTTVRALRVEAVDGLAGYGRVGVEPLRALLRDSDPYLRHAAVQALGQIGEGAADVTPQLRALIDAEEYSGRFVTASSKAGFQLDVVRTLIAIAPNDPETLSAIETVVERSPGLGLAAMVLELAVPGNPAEGQKPRYLPELLSRGSEPVAFYIMRALRSAKTHSKIPGLEFHPHLLDRQLLDQIEDYLRHPEVALRREAALLLRDVSSPSPSLVRTMTDLILDEHPEVQRVAASAIGRWLSGRGAESVERLRDGLERWLSVESVVADDEYWNDTTSLLRPAIDETFAHSKGLLIRYASHVSLSEFGNSFLTSRPDKIYQSVKQGLKKMEEPNRFERVTTRRILIRALGQQGVRALIAAPLLRRLTNDRAAPERWEAAIALWQVTGQPKEALEVLNRLVESFDTIEGNDPLYQILVRAIAACGKMGAPGLGFLSQVLTFQDDRLRLQAFIAVESQMESVAEARTIVERHVKDEYGVIRTRARKAIGRLTDGI